MAHKKAGGSPRATAVIRRDSVWFDFGGEQVLAGNIIARQRGDLPHNVGVGKDHTLFALINGKVEFVTKTKGRILRTSDE